MGEVEFFDKIKKVNRLISNEAREKIWSYILRGKFVSVKDLLKEVGEGEKIVWMNWEDFGIEKRKGEENG